MVVDKREAKPEYWPYRSDLEASERPKLPDMHMSTPVDSSSNRLTSLARLSYLAKRVACDKGNDRRFRRPFQWPVVGARRMLKRPQNWVHSLRQRMSTKTKDELVLCSPKSAIPQHHFVDFLQQDRFPNSRRGGGGGCIELGKRFWDACLPLKGRRGRKRRMVRLW